MKKKFTLLGDILNKEIPSASDRDPYRRSKGKWENSKFIPDQKNYSSPMPQDNSAQSVFDFLNLVYSWQAIVGERMAKFSIPLKLVRGTLTILCNHPAFAEQLAFVEGPLINQIQNHFPALKGKIKSLRFFNNAELFAKEFKTKIESNDAHNGVHEKIHQFSPNYKKIKQEASDALGELKDPEFQGLFASILAQCLNNK